VRSWSLRPRRGRDRDAFEAADGSAVDVELVHVVVVAKFSAFSEEGPADAADGRLDRVALPVASGVRGPGTLNGQPVISDRLEEVAADLSVGEVALDAELRGVLGFDGVGEGCRLGAHALHVSGAVPLVHSSGAMVGSGPES
jgi:hypothetical protein